MGCGKTGWRLAAPTLCPSHVPQLLPHLMLIEIVSEAGRERYRYRLVGTEIERNFGVSMTGRCIDELMRGEYLGFIEGLYRTLATKAVPVYSENVYDAQSGFDAYPEAFRTSRLMLPLSDDGEHVDRVLAGQIFTRRSRGGTHTVFVTQEKFRKAG
jgi:hypothetical protein